MCSTPLSPTPPTPHSVTHPSLKKCAFEIKRLYSFPFHLTHSLQPGMCLEKTCKRLEKTHTHTRREGVRWWRGSQRSSLTKQICSSLQGWNSLRGSSLHPNCSQICIYCISTADWGLRLNYAVTVTLGNVHKSASDRYPRVHRLINADPFSSWRKSHGTDSTASPLSSVQLLNSVHPPDTPPHRPPTRCMDKLNITDPLLFPLPLRLSAGARTGKKKKGIKRRWLKMENSRLHARSRAFRSMCGLVEAWAPPPHRRKTTTSCLSSRRIPPAHSTCCHGNEKVLALVTVTYVGQNVIPLKTSKKKGSRVF